MRFQLFCDVEIVARIHEELQHTKKLDYRNTKTEDFYAIPSSLFAI